MTLVMTLLQKPHSGVLMACQSLRSPVAYTYGYRARTYSPASLSPSGLSSSMPAGRSGLGVLRAASRRACSPADSDTDADAGADAVAVGGVSDDETRPSASGRPVSKDYARPRTVDPPLGVRAPDDLAPASTNDDHHQQQQQEAEAPPCCTPDPHQWPWASSASSVSTPTRRTRSKGAEVSVVVTVPLTGWGGPPSTLKVALHVVVSVTTAP